MSKTLLIHHDNVPDGTTTKKIKFDYKHSKNTPNVHTYISKEILPKIEDTELIFIKDNLSSNYLELYGLLVAYHIRLSESLKNTRYIPIVILGEIDACTLSKLVPMANILFTKNIFLEPNTAETIEKYKTKSLFSLNEEDYKTHFLDRVAIGSPENSSNHSIANNWAIDRWARFVGAKSDAISDNKEKIENMLYFKYLLALNPIEKKKGINHIPKQAQGDGKILYIDDEWDKGWSDILSHYFSRNSAISFETFEHKFEDETNLFSLKSEVTKKIEASSPDIVILDLRLLKNDHTGTNREDTGRYSGVQISTMIKEINPGIQVIMLTATGNSLILEKLYEHGILGYIKKEHPEDKSLKTKDNIRKLAELLTEGFEKKYLKKIWKTQKEIVSLDIFKNQDFQAMKFEIDTIFELLDSNLDKRYTYSMLSLFQALEEVNNYYINDKTKKWKDGYTEVKIEGNGYTKQKIVAVLNRLNLFKKFSSDIDTISKMRKNVIHPPEGAPTEQPTQDNIITWLTMLCEILKKMDTDA